MGKEGRVKDWTGLFFSKAVGVAGPFFREATTDVMVFASLARKVEA